MSDMNAWTARDYANAAEFYHNKDMDSDQALAWMKKAVSMNANAFWWQYSYAKMLADNGETAEAIAAAERSLKTAKASPGGDSGYIARNEALLASLR
jgi:predicted Zn-dependent protease